MIQFDSRQRFQNQKELAEAHRQHMASPMFHAAAEAALQVHADVEMRNAKDWAVTCHRIAGGREFLRQLMNLSEVATVPVKPDRKELNYNIPN